jgi:hypothetical protein
MTATTTTPQTPDRAYFDAIAAHMPDWEAREDTSFSPSYPTRHDLVYTGTNPDYQGAALYAYVDTRSHKIEWRCNLHIPSGRGDNSYFILDALSYDERESKGVLTANIGLSKEPAKVARELERRLLPRYLDLYAKGMARVHATRTQHDADEALAQQLATVLGCQVHRYRQQDDQPPRVDSPAGTLIVEHGSVRFVFTPSFSPEHAVELCALLASWQTT